MLKHYALVILSSLLYGKLVFSQEVLQSRDDAEPEYTTAEKAYLEDYGTSKIRFKTVPVDHMIPARQTVIFAMDAHMEDVEIDGKANEKPIEGCMYCSSSDYETFASSGYRLTPFAGLSLKNVALGLLLEKSQKSIVSTDGSGQKTDFYGVKSYSEVEHTGVGFNVYLNPFPKFKRVFWTFHIGTKLLDATHKVRTESLSSGEVDYRTPNPDFNDGEEFETIKYSVSTTNIASTFNIKFGKRVKLIPWINYRTVDLSNMDFLLGENESTSKVENFERFVKDKRLIWNVGEPLEYGIDFSFRLYRLDIHCGSLLGALYNSVFSEDERILRDEGFSLSFSYDFKVR